MANVFFGFFFSVLWFGSGWLLGYLWPPWEPYQQITGGVGWLIGMIMWERFLYTEKRYSRGHPFLGMALFIIPGFCFFASAVWFVFRWSIGRP